MKLFKWSLQRLLNVTVQRERVLRSELLRLAQEMARIRHELLRQKAVLRSQLDELTRKEVPERLPERKIFMDFSQATDKTIKKLTRELERLGTVRKETTDRFLRVRGSRQTLERLREEARQRHIHRQLRLEQKELDESAQVSFARKMIGARLANRD